MHSPPDSRNLMLTLSYQGYAFQGYQSQPHAKTVQGVLMKAWKILTGENAILCACSRLDAGVDARQFVLNFNTKTAIHSDLILTGLNGILHCNLKEPISIYRAEDTVPDFHARFDAIGKHYRYLLWHGRGHHAAITPRCWLLKTRNKPLHLPSLFEQFIGTHNFSAFRASDCNAKNTTRTITAVKTWEHPRYPELTVVDIWGEGFLKNMIRNIVGTAVDVSTKRLLPDTISLGFVHGIRAQVGQCAPAHGLRLEEVFYSTETYKKSIAQEIWDV